MDPEPCSASCSLVPRGARVSLLGTKAPSPRDTRCPDAVWGFPVELGGVRDQRGGMGRRRASLGSTCPRLLSFASVPGLAGPTPHSRVPSLWVVASTGPFNSLSPSSL